MFFFLNGCQLCSRDSSHLEPNHDPLSSHTIFTLVPDVPIYITANDAFHHKNTITIVFITMYITKKKIKKFGESHAVPSHNTRDGPGGITALQLYITVLDRPVNNITPAFYFQHTLY